MIDMLIALALTALVLAPSAGVMIWLTFPDSRIGRRVEDFLVAETWRELRRLTDKNPRRLPAEEEAEALRELEADPDPLARKFRELESGEDP